CSPSMFSPQALFLARPKAATVVDRGLVQSPTRIGHCEIICNLFLEFCYIQCGTAGDPGLEGGAQNTCLLYSEATPWEGASSGAGAARPVAPRRLVGSSEHPRPRNVMSAVQPGEPSKSAILVMVTRRSGPHLLEATVIPAVLFYACFVVVGLGAAYAAAVGWSYAVFVRRIVRHEAIPPILVLGGLGGHRGGLAHLGRHRPAADRLRGRRVLAADVGGGGPAAGPSVVPAIDRPVGRGQPGVGVAHDRSARIPARGGVPRSEAGLRLGAHGRGGLPHGVNVAPHGTARGAPFPPWTASDPGLSGSLSARELSSGPGRRGSDADVEFAPRPNAPRDSGPSGGRTPGRDGHRACGGGRGLRPRSPTPACPAPACGPRSSARRHRHRSGPGP